MICPECKNELESGVSVCPTCGFDVNANKWECEECHTFVDNNVDVCPTCGGPKKITVQDELKADTVQPDINKRKIVGIAMILAACIVCAIGFTRITSSKYKFYKQHYAECEEGYIESKALADSYYPGFFRSSYEEIASAYKEMMDEDMKKIKSFKIEAGTCWGAGAGLFVAGLLVIGIKRKVI